MPFSTNKGALIILWMLTEFKMGKKKQRNLVRNWNKWEISKCGKSGKIFGPKWRKRRHRWGAPSRHASTPHRSYWLVRMLNPVERRLLPFVTAAWRRTSSNTGWRRLKSSATAVGCFDERTGGRPPGGWKENLFRKEEPQQKGTVPT